VSVCLCLVSVCVLCACVRACVRVCVCARAYIYIYIYIYIGLEDPGGRAHRLWATEGQVSVTTGIKKVQQKIQGGRSAWTLGPKSMRFVLLGFFFEPKVYAKKYQVY
jgi:hypothetical protein